MYPNQGGPPYGGYGHNYPPPGYGNPLPYVRNQQHPYYNQPPQAYLPSRQSQPPMHTQQNRAAAASHNGNNSGVPVKIWVGKLPVTLEEEFIEKLLGTCGVLKEWKRVVNHLTQGLKPFGFATYESAVGAINALELLQGLKIDDGQILLKCGKESQKIIDEWKEGGNSVSEEEKNTAIEKRDALLNDRKENVNVGLQNVLRNEAERAKEIAEKRKKLKGKRKAAKQEGMRGSLKRRDIDDDMKSRRNRIEDRLRKEEGDARKGDVMLDRWLSHERHREEDRIKRATDLEDRRARKLQELKSVIETDIDRKKGVIFLRKEIVRKLGKKRNREKKEDEVLRLKMQQDKISWDTNAIVQTKPKAVQNTNVLGGENQAEEQNVGVRKTSSISFIPDAVDTLYRRKLTPKDIQTLIKTVPVSRDDLYSHVVDWQFLISIGALNVESGKIKDFVNKSITELVGGEMEDMVSFIISMLTKGCSPQELESKMALVLQEDAQTFVIKLWRMMIYEEKAEKYQRGITTELQ